MKNLRSDEIHQISGGIYPCVLDSKNYTKMATGTSCSFDFKDYHGVIKNVGYDKSVIYVRSVDNIYMGAPILPGATYNPALSNMEIICLLSVPLENGCAAYLYILKS